MIDNKSLFIGHKFSGKYLDCGSMDGYIKSTIEIQIMKICIIGSGYVGLVSGTCFSELGNKLFVLIIISERLKTSKGIVPIYEPGLEELIMKC